MTLRQRQVLLIVAVVGGVLIADQVSKVVVRATVAEERFYDAGRDSQFFRISYQRNPDLVGGIFHGRPFMVFVAPIVAALVLIYLFRHVDPQSKLQTIAYGMIAGGALGNLVDRFRLGAVTDFLKFHFTFVPFNFPWKDFPAFNLADTGICTGVFLLIVTWYVFGDGPKKAEG